MIALVTGGTRGIGLAIVRALRSAGHKVAVVGRTENFTECDLYLNTDLLEMSCELLVAEVVSRLGFIDILVNNAGAQKINTLYDYSISDFNNSYKLMVAVPFMLSKAVKKFMPSGGHIINILSTAAFQGARNISGYVAAKHGLLGLTRAMAVELAPKIRVNAVAPGLTATDMIADMTPERKAFLESITPSGRFCKPDEIAGAVMFLVNSTAIYGQTITVDGGWLAKNG